MLKLAIESDKLVLEEYSTSSSFRALLPAISFVKLRADEFIMSNALTRCSLPS